MVLHTIYVLLLDSPDGQSPCTEMQTPRGQEVLFPLLTKCPVLTTVAGTQQIFAELH